MASTMRVLVTDGAERASLVVTRSLGKRGIDVTVGESYNHCTTFLSKYCKNRVIYPSPDNDCDEFVEGLLDIVRGKEYEVIYPIREATTILVSYYKKEFEKHVRVPLPDYEKMMIVHDKGQTLKFALEHGIPCPQVYLVSSTDELKDLSRNIQYPVVIKPRCKTIWKDRKPAMLKVTSRNYVHDEKELISRYKEIYDTSLLPPLIEEYIPGDGYGVECLCRHGEPRALFMHHRLREYPITGGASTLRESIYDEDLKNLTFELLGKLKWHGVAMVEFKRDRRDGIPKLMEVNGRFWGSLALSTAAGVDFPYLLHKMITEGDVEPVFDYQTGIKCRWLVPGDVLWLGSSLKQRNNRLSILREFFDFRGQHDDIWSINDPLPALGALLDVARLTGEVIKGRRSISGEFKSKE